MISPSRVLLFQILLAKNSHVRPSLFDTRHSFRHILYIWIEMMTSPSSETDTKKTV